MKIVIAFSQRRTAAEPQPGVEQGFVPGYKLLLIGGRQNRKDAVRLCSVYIVDHRLFPAASGREQGVSCDPDPPVVPSDRILDPPELITSRQGRCALDRVARIAEANTLSPHPMS